jgi:hypothetical protein
MIYYSLVIILFFSSYIYDIEILSNNENNKSALLSNPKLFSTQSNNGNVTLSEQEVKNGKEEPDNYCKTPGLSAQCGPLPPNMIDENTAKQTPPINR